jgi:hypothetical protein
VFSVQFLSGTLSIVLSTVYIVSVIHGTTAYISCQKRLLLYSVSLSKGLCVC